MNEPLRTSDQSIERILAWRADRAAPTGLLDEIHERLEMEPQHRAVRTLVFPSRFRGLAWVLVVLALLVAVAIGAASLAGSRATLLSDTSPAVPPTIAPAVVQTGVETICLTQRPVPFDLAHLQLTGTWTDGGGTYYFRQLGDTLWIVGPGRVTGVPGAYDERAFTGTISGDTVQLNWAEVGALTPDQPRTPPWENGTITLRIQSGSGGNTELASTSQAGTRLTGPAFAPFVFTACTPERLTVPSSAP